MAISVLFSKRSNERSIVNSKDEYSDKKKRVSSQISTIKCYIILNIGVSLSKQLLSTNN